MHIFHLTNVQMEGFEPTTTFLLTRFVDEGGHPITLYICINNYVVRLVGLEPTKSLRS